MQPVNIYLFGKTSLSGEAFCKILNSEKPNIKIHHFSRVGKGINKMNLKEPESFALVNKEKFTIISFAPIWDLSYFLNYLFNNEKHKLENLDGILACFLVCSFFVFVTYFLNFFSFFSNIYLLFLYLFLK